MTHKIKSMQMMMMMDGDEGDNDKDSILITENYSDSPYICGSQTLKTTAWMWQSFYRISLGTVLISAIRGTKCSDLEISDLKTTGSEYNKL